MFKGYLMASSKKYYNIKQYYCTVPHKIFFQSLTYHLPHLEDVVFRHTADHPRLYRVPGEV